MGIAPRQLLRTGEAAYRELGLGDQTLSDEEIIRALVEHTELLQRPIVERGERAVLARPVELVVDFLEPPKPREDPGSAGPRAAGKP